MERKKLRAREYRKEQRSKQEKINKEKEELREHVKSLEAQLDIEKGKVTSLSLELGR